MMYRAFSAVAVILATSASALAAQAKPPIPLRTTTLVASSDSGVFRNVTDVRHNDNNSVFVNDTLQRKIVLLDAALKKSTTIIDNAGTANIKYGSGAARLLSDRGGLAFFFANGSQVMTPISTDGKLARNIEFPHVARVHEFSDPMYGTPAIPPGAAVMYRGSRPPRPGARQDSAPVLVVGAGGRIADTIALLALPSLSTMSPGAGAKNALPASDEWAMLYDGTVAVVRVRDYRIDWNFASGNIRTTGTLPVDWRAISAEEKPRVLDDLRTQFSAKIELSDLPEFFPPVRPGHTRADNDNNVWTLPYSSSIEQGYVYDVTNKVKGLTERVQIPAGRTLIGFGRQTTGILYLAYSPAPGDVRLERVKVNR